MSSSSSLSNSPASPSSSSRRFWREHLHQPKRGASQAANLIELHRLTPSLQKLKNGTFVLPGTGERLRRQISLRVRSDGLDGPADQEELENSGLWARERQGRIRRDYDGTLKSARDCWQWLRTPVAKDILKCQLAYILGSMGTFFPPFAKFLGHQDGKHMTATITVYFHPARTAGSMVEAAIVGWLAFFYAVFISVSSMGVAVFSETQLGLIELGYALILIVFCGGGLGFVGWIKQRFNAPLVSVACSLASLAIITVLTKEESVQIGVFTNDKIVQVMKMVVMGILSTSFVSLCLWRRFARAELREHMIKISDSMGDMLTLIARGFLTGSEIDIRSTSFNNASSRHQSALKQLPKSLLEAKREHYLLGTEDQYKIEANLVTCLQRLSHSIGGLKSAATTQFSLMHETVGASNGTPVNALRHSLPRNLNTTQSAPPSSKSDRFPSLTAIVEASEEDNWQDDLVSPGFESDSQITRRGTETSFASVPASQSPEEIFVSFIQHLGPSMKSLAYTLSEILSELPFGHGPEYNISINEHFMLSVKEALELYSDARGNALEELYKSKELDRSRPESIEADFEEVAASCGHFSFSLQDFAHEMQNYLVILEDLKAVMENPPQRSWSWARFWRKNASQSFSEPAAPSEQEPLVLDLDGRTVPPKDFTESANDRAAAQNLKIAAVETPSKQGMYTVILPVVRILERNDIRFAVKVGIGAAVYALFAFIPATRPYYQHWRGEWGLLSYMLVCSMTIGASNTTGSARFVGTFIGAIIAVIVWIICQGNAFALALCGGFVSMPCFYLIIAKGKGPFGRFIMLTYNLSCLYAYSLSVREGEDDDDEGGVTPIISEIALHRVVAVLAGVVWSLIITRVVWPISARHEFKDGLSLLLLRMGLIWKRDPLSALVDGESQNRYMNIGEEFAFRRYVTKLDGLRSSATHEFELRGPFPSKSYGRIMESMNKMLDAFHAMNVVIQRNANASPGVRSLLKYTTEERTQLCTRISHLLQVLASSMKLEYPLNDALPSTENARDRLLSKIFQYRKDVAASTAEGVDPVAKDGDYALIYAYTLVTGQLAHEIKKVEKQIEDLFGILDEDVLRLQ